MSHPEAGRTYFLAAALGRCPACRQGKLFKSYLKVNPVCSQCGCDFSAANAGDGPVVFVILVVGMIVCGAFVGVSLAHPEMQVATALMIFLPLTLILTLVIMLPFKGVMLAAQIHNRVKDR